MTTTIRNRTKSDSALLARATSAAKDNKLKLGVNKYVEEEKIGHFRYLYLCPLLLQLSERLRRSMVSGSGSVIGEEGCEREEGGKTGLVITVEDVDHQEGQQRRVRRSRKAR